jgi:hypothetical protein
VIGDVEAKLREIAQLWALGQQLPHLQLPKEKALVAELEAFDEGRAAFCSLEAATAGLQSRWRSQDLMGILRIARKLPAEIRKDREVRTCIAHARRLLGAVRRRHKSHRHSTTALNDLLNRWDPIGVADFVADEYAGYCVPLLRLLVNGADEIAIARELARIVSEQMGLRTDPPREAEHAAAIMAWYEGLTPSPR